MARANTIKTEANPEFTDYTVSGTDEGRHQAALLRIAYEARNDHTEAQRRRRPSIAKQMVPHAQALIRCGYPKKRERDEDIPSKRGVPHSGFLKQWKIVTKASGLVKIHVLHATRGWKVYA